MIAKTILNFVGLYAAFQFCVITMGHVFNIDIPSSAQIGLMIGATYGAMMASVSAFGRAPTLGENWILSVSVNLCALAISMVFLAATLYVADGFYAIDEFMVVFRDLPLSALFIGLAAAFLVQTALCLLIFGKMARRHLSKAQPIQRTAKT